MAQQGYSLPNAMGCYTACIGTSHISSAACDCRLQNHQSRESLSLSFHIVRTAGTRVTQGGGRDGP
ncbi:hypothetical protein JB92DRAFT_2881852 [Gautieria morchelliformis]|nr:hypothetical protein JB92DRAFT_2881852 [Gautieria morchelliformis]